MSDQKKPEGPRVVRSLKEAMIEFNTRNQVQDPPRKTVSDGAPNIHSQQPKSE